MNFCRGYDLVSVYLRGPSYWKNYFKSIASPALIIDHEFFFDDRHQKGIISFDGYIFENMSVQIGGKKALIDISGSEWINANLNWRLLKTGLENPIKKVNFISTNVSITDMHVSESDERLTIYGCEFIRSSLEFHGAIERATLEIVYTKFIESKVVNFDIESDAASLIFEHNKVDCKKFLLGTFLTDFLNFSMRNCKFYQGLEVCNFSGGDEFEISKCVIEGKMKFESCDFNNSSMNFLKLKVSDGIEFDNGTSFKSKLVVFKGIEILNGNFDISGSRILINDFIVDGVKLASLDNDINFSYLRVSDTVITLKNCFAGSLVFQGVELIEGLLLIQNNLIRKQVSFYESKFDRYRVSFQDNDFRGLSLSFYWVEFKKSNFNMNRDSIKLKMFEVEHSRFLDSNFIINELNLGASGIKISSNLFEKKFYLDSWKGVGNLNYFSLERNEFKEQVTISDGRYNCIPDFRLSKFSILPILSGVSCKSKTEKHNDKRLGISRSSDEEDFQRIMKLKEIAEDNKDHHKVLELHAKEMRSRRWNTMGKRASLTDMMYSIFSDYGQSMSKPIYALIALIFSFSLIFHYLAKDNVPDPKYLFMKMVDVSYWDTLVFSLINSISILSIQKAAQKEYIQTYFNGMDYSVVNALVGLEGLLSLPCLFLIGLALRNRFKI